MTEPTQEQWYRIVCEALLTGYIDLGGSEARAYASDNPEEHAWGADGIEDAGDRLAAAFRKVMGKEGA